jgi:hypothetical protein
VAGEGILIRGYRANAGVLDYLGRGRGNADQPISTAPADVSHPYYTLGTHPDLVERLWAQLNAGLPEDCRWVVYRTPVLMHPRSGAILAFGAGTSYALWLPDDCLPAALRAGAEQVHTYIGGRVLDLRTLGRGWVFGGWYPGEDEWCLAAYRAAGAATS